MYRLLTLVIMVAFSGPTVSLAANQPKASHWAFQPITRPTIPLVARSDLVRTPVDAFILAKQEAHGLSPASVADRTTLVRRLSLNLWGLPPLVEAVHQFVNDPAPDAYERLIEKLLASPKYGERWARHWLDVARFAESGGYVENHMWPHFWRYRDWVVQSFNDDKPFDVFVMQQIAGDELQPYADENIIATGFLAAARLATEELSCVRQENDMYVDIVNATSSALMGLTMGCAQCHDHKFDPITERDYYRMQAFFFRGYPGNLVLGSSSVSEEFHDVAQQLTDKTLQVRRRILSEAYGELPEDERQILLASPEDRTPEEEAKFRVRRAALNIRLAGCNGYRIAEDEKNELDRLRSELDKHQANVVQTWGFYSPVTSPHALSALPMAGNFPLLYDTHNLSRRHCYLPQRGDPYRPREPVEPGFPDALNPDQIAVPASRPRTALAKWITSPNHPLTARVWVNRIWSYHFAKGLVATPGNFGTRGAPPTHPMLLDYLASELVESGWSTKHIQRLILKSNTYKQAAHHDLQAAKIDPDNELYWRWPRRRLEAEAIRDMMLAATGKLDETPGGPSIPPGQSSTRRSLYLFQKRDQPYEIAQLFDGPTEMSASCSERQVSTSALQPLYLLNSPEIVLLAEAFANTLKDSAPEDSDKQVELAFERVLGRTPTEIERQAATEYLDYVTQEPVTPQGLRPRIVQVEWSAGHDQVETGPEAIVRPGEISKYTLHFNGYADHQPGPDRGTVTYQFDTPETVAEVELIVHANGITQIEGFVGDDIDDLRSIGIVLATGAERGKPFPTERGSDVFSFEQDQIEPSRVFRFVVRETVKADGYANYQAFPRTADGQRILPSVELVPDIQRPMSPLAKFSQAMMNLNEFFYVP